jgi:octanoyl-[GcvH]:protein N-octanoyltransferase
MQVPHGTLVPGADARDGPSAPIRVVLTGEEPRLVAVSPVLAEALSDSVRRGGPCVFLVRRHEAHLLLGPQDERLPRLSSGLAWAAARGLPVYQRISGGTAVLLDTDCLSFAMAVPCTSFSHIRRNYDALTRPVRRALAALGAPVSFGAAVGAYCEGPYDLLHRGRKLAGIAQSVRGGVALVSGMVLVRQDPQAATDLLNTFYRVADPARTAAGWCLTAEPLTHLERALDRPVSVRELEEALVRSVAAEYAAEFSAVTPGEEAAAADLLRRRRLA